MDKVVLNNSALESIVKFLVHLDENSKKAVIAKLQASLNNGIKKKKGRSLAELAGQWEDDRTTEQIIADIRESSHLTREIEPFD